MTDAVFVIAAWLITGVVLVGYAAYVIQRGKALSRKVPVEERRWTSK